MTTIAPKIYQVVTGLSKPPVNHADEMTVAVVKYNRRSRQTNLTFSG
jgi:hypothetical protein